MNASLRMRLLRRSSHFSFVSLSCGVSAVTGRSSHACETPEVCEYEDLGRNLVGVRGPCLVRPDSHVQEESLFRTDYPRGFLVDVRPVERAEEFVGLSELGERRWEAWADVVAEEPRAPPDPRVPVVPDLRGFDELLVSGGNRCGDS